MHRVRLPRLDSKVFPTSTRALELCLAGVTFCVFCLAIYTTVHSKVLQLDSFSVAVYKLAMSPVSTAPIIVSLLHILSIWKGIRFHYIRLVSLALMFIIWTALVIVVIKSTGDAVTPLLVAITVIDVSIAYSFCIQLYKEFT